LHVRYAIRIRVTLLHPKGVGGRPVVACIVVVVGEGVEAVHARDLERPAGSTIVRVGVGGGHDRIGLALGARDNVAADPRDGFVDVDGSH